MTKHEIDIPDLPKGWRAVAHRIPRKDENYLSVDGLVEKCFSPIYVHRIIVEKIKLRRIVLEETELNHLTRDMQLFNNDDVSITLNAKKIWRVVEEE